MHLPTALRMFPRFPAPPTNGGTGLPSSEPGGTQHPSLGRGRCGELPTWDIRALMRRRLPSYHHRDQRFERTAQAIHSQPFGRGFGCPSCAQVYWYFSARQSDCAIPSNVPLLFARGSRTRLSKTGSCRSRGRVVSGHRKISFEIMRPQRSHLEGQNRL